MRRTHQAITEMAKSRGSKRTDRRPIAAAPQSGRRDADRAAPERDARSAWG